MRAVKEKDKEKDGSEEAGWKDETRKRAKCREKRQEQGIRVNER